MTGRPLPATASALKDLRKRWSEEVEGARRRQERRGEELRRLEEGEKRRLEEAARKWKERRRAREAGRAPREAAAEESAAGAEETAGTGAAIRVAAAEADKTESTASPTDPPIQRRPHSGNGQDEPPRTMTPSGGLEAESRR